jgi:gluconokinase
VAGSGDGGAAQLGSGALLQNEACITIGTSGAVRMFIRQPVTDPQQKLFTYLFVNDWYFTGGATNNGGSLMPWFAGVFLPGLDGTQSFEKAIELANASQPGAKGLLFVPYLHGERAPVWDADAVGQFYGIKSIHGTADFARAVIEGVLLNIAEIFALLPSTGHVDTIYANGGFFSDPFMAQLLADITGKKVLLQKDADSSAMGAIFIGMLATGRLKNIEEVKQFITTDETYLPDAGRNKIYQGVFGRYKALGKWFIN